MKKFWNFLLMFPITAILAYSCQSEDILYADKEYVSFADSLYTMPVLDTDATFNVMVSATTTAAYDRNYAVEVINERSTAVRGLHFDFVDNSNNVVIKAGERVAAVVLKGHYDNVRRDDSLCISLRLVEPAEQKWDLYGDVTRVDFVKCRPFNMDDFLMIEGTGDNKATFTMLASFPFAQDVTSFSVKGYKKDDHTLMLTNMFQASNVGDLRVIFDDSDPLDLLVTVPEQAAFRESTYGNVWVRSVEQYPSYFNTFDNFFILYLEVYVPQIGSFGVYQYIFRALDPETAEDQENGAVTRMSALSGSSVFGLKQIPGKLIAPGNIFQTTIK